MAKLIRVTKEGLAEIRKEALYGQVCVLPSNPKIRVSIQLPCLN